MRVGPGDGRCRGCLRPEGYSQHAPGPWREQLSADLVEVGQCEHGLRSRQVLGQASIPHLGEAPQLLDDPKRMLAAGSGPRASPVDQPPARAQRSLGGGTPIDPVAHSPSLEELSIVFLPVRLIAEHLPLLPMQQVRQLRDVGYAGVGRSHGMDDTAPVRTDVQLHPEVPVAGPCGSASSQGRGSGWRSWSSWAPR